ncbi:SDR family NAD(P)-dependent oxidoreductase [Gelidibacter mesophilus]|uniref:SDR family NAD(P)-dependent oxidoreductase n=1 Tax=Gelidibacter mesophilus TaxID=169050 RepID=UPI0003F89386|nr:SDR family NAD(P)-dependent oxidoreductase [Gelidibacter mesophilus]
MNQIVPEALQIFEPIDSLINNGGISQRALVIDTEISVYKKLIAIDYLGTVALTKALLPNFVAHQAGHFVTVSTVMEKFSSPLRSGYCGAKHALHSFFDTLGLEHDKDNIKVTLICPGFFNTDVARNALIGDGKQPNTKVNPLGVDDFSIRMLRPIEK